MKVISIIKTCDACPSQWEGTLDDGRMIYIRYRYGALQVHKSECPTSNIIDAVRAKPIYGGKIGDSMDGYMNYNTLKVFLHELVELPPLEDSRI